jgi:hypothetical protein
MELLIKNKLLKQKTKKEAKLKTKAIKNAFKASKGKGGKLYCLLFLLVRLCIWSVFALLSVFLILTFHLRPNSTNAFMVISAIILASVLFCYILCSPLCAGSYLRLWNTAAHNKTKARDGFYFLFSGKLFFKCIALSLNILARKILWLILYSLAGSALVFSAVRMLLAAKPLDNILTPLIMLAGGFFAIAAGLVCFWLTTLKYRLCKFLFVDDPTLKINALFTAANIAASGKRGVFAKFAFACLPFDLGCLTVLALPFLWARRENAYAALCKNIFETLREES